MRNKIVLPAIFLIAILAAGCQLSSDKINQGKDLQFGGARITIAGISLGDSDDQVREKLGTEYTSESMDGDWFGELTSRWLYKNDIEIIIGDETHQVLQVNLYSKRFTTTAGCQVGDKAEKVLSIYQDKYPLARDHFEGKEIPGWFVVEDGVWLIFNFNDDNTMVNQAIKADDQVKSIHLVYEKFMD